MSFLIWCAQMVGILLVVLAACIVLSMLFAGGWATGAVLFGGYCVYKHYEDKPT